MPPTIRPEFVECPSCASKPGSPTLCLECLERRELFTELGKRNSTIDRVVTLLRKVACLGPGKEPHDWTELIETAEKIKDTLEVYERLRRDAAIRMEVAVGLHQQAETKLDKLKAACRALLEVWDKEALDTTRDVYKRMDELRAFMAGEADIDSELAKLKAELRLRDTAIQGIVAMIRGTTGETHTWQDLVVETINLKELLRGDDARTRLKSSGYQPIAPPPKNPIPPTGGSGIQSPNKAESELEWYKTELKDSGRLVERLGTLLRGVAIAFRGPEPELVRWDWSGLPEFAQVIVKELGKCSSVARCHACFIEAELGIEEDPHPLDPAAHTCKPLTP